MADRRRINGPLSNTSSVRFESHRDLLSKPPQRLRKPNELRRIFLKTGLIPAASGSAYFELETPSDGAATFLSTTSTIKLSCAVHGPRPLTRNASFSPNLQLNASIKFAPFATRQRRGYVRDNIERDLGSHLESALKGVIIPDRWPKSGVDIAITVLEGEEDCLWAQQAEEGHGVSGVGLMNVLAGSITVATAALVDAGIDCLDLLTGGVAAFAHRDGTDALEILDPCPSEHKTLESACVVAYLPSRDEITEVWYKGRLPGGADDSDMFEKLLNAATRSARGSHSIVSDMLKESAAVRLNLQKHEGTRIVEQNNVNDSEMKT